MSYADYAGNWKQRLDDWKEEDKELFLKFAEDARTFEITDRRIEKYRCDLKMIRVHTGFTPLQATKDMESLKQAVVKINSDAKLGWASKFGMKRTLGSLFNFRHSKDRSLKYASPDLKRLIEHRFKASDKRLARPIITREEIRDLGKFGDRMDSAIVWLLFESGMRIGEFVQLKKSDFQETKEGLIVRVPPGKTGEREVIVLEARKAVKDWLASHQDKSPEAMLWLGITEAGIAKRIRSMKEQLNKQRKKSGVPLFSKSVNCHNFRHSRASELGGEPGMTEAILCKFFGWEIGSRMPHTYLHITPEQVRKAVLATYGKAKPEDKVIPTLWTCRRCKEENSLADNFCGRCGGDREGEPSSKITGLENQIEQMQVEIEKLQRLAAYGTVAKAKKRYEEMMKAEID